MANLGFFAGGLANSLNQGFARNQQADFQQQELQIQQQAQDNQQKRFDMARLDTLLADAGKHLSDTIDALKSTGTDPKKIQSIIQGTFDNYRRLSTAAGYPGVADANLAAWMAAPPSTAVTQAQAVAKETPAKRESEQALAELRRNQADPFGLTSGPGTGTVSPPGSNTFSPGTTLGASTVEELPPGAPLPIAGPRTAQATPPGTQGQVPQSENEARGDAYLATLPNPRVAAAVKSVADYEVNPSTLLGRGTFAQRTQFLGMVQEYAAARGQKWDQSDFTAKNKAMAGFAQRVGAISLADSELRRSLPILRDASNAVNRTEYKTINKLIESWQENTGGTAVVQLGEALNTTRNLYARAINPTGGKPTVNDLNHADQVLQAAWSKGQIEAGVNQLLREVDAAKASLPDARNEILGILSGKPSPASAKPQDTGVSGTSGGKVPPPPPGFILQSP